MSACVFCGQPIEPGQSSVARPPMAAHAACADAALADDAHWDAIAERAGEPAEAGPPGRGRAGSLGCWTAVVGLVVVVGGAARRWNR